ncbi:MAG: CRP/FNR family cyclic AMP-dependent transcriptional regulator [Myxococcota bacterium]|jgi:CRP/FNR family cyclic AMP-dependent transcriptional regulator
MSSPLGLSRVQMSRMLMAHPIFSGLEEDELDELVESSEILRLVTGECLFAEGDPGSDLYVVLGGRFRISCTSPDGVEVVVGMVEDNGLIGEMSAFDPAPRSATASAAVESTVVRVPNTQFLEMVRQGRPAARGLLRWIRSHVCHRLRVLDERIDAVFLPAAEPPRADGLWRASVGEEQR